MLFFRAYLQKLRLGLELSPPADFEKEMRFVRPFYWFVIGGLVILYGFSVYYSPPLHNPIRLILFTILILIHGAIHWISPHLVYRPIFLLPYLLAQGSISFALVLLADNISLSYGLFAALLGQILGMFRYTKWAILSVIYFLALSFTSYLIVTDFNFIWSWVATAVPLTVFIWLYVSLYTRQALAREEAQGLLAEIEEAHRQLGDYATKVEDLTIKGERQRMARELHDTLAQGLAGLILQLEAADAYIIDQNPVKAQTIIRQAMERARSTLAGSRRAISNLRNTMTIPENLNETIQEEIEKFKNTTGISCTYQMEGCKLIPPNLVENIHRAVNEGLVNIAKYAQATEVIIQFVCDETEVRLCIEDNGIGFNPDEAVGRTGHYGLLGLRERTRMSGGTFLIESSKGRGSRLKLKFPVVNSIDS